VGGGTVHTTGQEELYNTVRGVIRNAGVIKDSTCRLSVIKIQAGGTER
jgi:hypothetical protein